jgi:hypothetical protein
MSTSVQFLLVHFYFYIVNNITHLNTINPYGLHMESDWVHPYFPVFRGGVHVVQME